MKSLFLASTIALSFATSQAATPSAMSTSAASSALSASTAPASLTSLPNANAAIRHVLLISVDGLHAIDLVHFIAAHPDSTFARMARQGIEYSNARTVEPADSFPGLAALITGGTPAVTGIYYDDTYSRALSAPGSDCRRTGTRVPFDESIDKRGPDGYAMIDPAKLPRDPQQGCTPVFPHAYLRVNTVFEVVRAAGGYTAWTDKHPAYDIVNGPSGKGVDDLFVPEIGANYEGLSPHRTNGITSSLTRTEDYDAMKARAVINEIDGRCHDGTSSHVAKGMSVQTGGASDPIANGNDAARVPTVFGLNMQAVNVAQKLYGYRDADGDLTPGVDHAIAHADKLVGDMLSELTRQGLRDDTLVILTAKHGNGPIDPAKLHKIDKQKLADVVDAAVPGGLAQLTTDHGALIWLHDRAQTGSIVAALRANAAALGIADVLSGDRLAERFGSPMTDSRVPDIVIVSNEGVIYTSPKDGKLAEHGGFHDDDRHVALLLSSPALADTGIDGLRVTAPVSTTSVAPTILNALGLSPSSLQAVVIEGTPTLPRIDWKHGS